MHLLCTFLSNSCKSYLPDYPWSFAASKAYFAIHKKPEVQGEFHFQAHILQWLCASWLFHLSHVEKDKWGSRDLHGGSKKEYPVLGRTAAGYFEAWNWIHRGKPGYLDGPCPLKYSVLPHPKDSVFFLWPPPPPRPLTRWSLRVFKTPLTQITFNTLQIWT